MRNKKIKLSYLENEKFYKQSILCLENYFFNSIIIEVENIINEEDRIEKIEERLEGIFSNYDNSKYLLRYEKIFQDSKNEKLAIHLLDLDLLEKNPIFNDMNEYKKYSFISIIPSFLKVREFQDESNFFNFDISKKAIVISKYTSNLLENISIYQISDKKENFKENYSNIINTYLDSIDKAYSIVFTGEQIDNNILMLKNRKIYNFEIEEFTLDKAPNFLPDKLKNIYTYFYSNTRYFLTLLIFSLILFLSTIFLNYKIDKLENIYVDIQVQNSTLEDKISSTREEMMEIEKLKLSLQKKLENNKSSELKLNFLLSFLSEISKDIKILSIENDKNSIINIIGISNKNKKILNFLKEIETSKYFKLINYDYIINTDNIFEFKVEIKYIPNDK